MGWLLTVRAGPLFKRPMGVLLAGILVFHAGWYMLLPFLVILFTGRRGLTPAEVGTVMAAQSISLVLGSLAGGALADRFGRRTTMVGGLVLRALGVGGLGLATSFPSAVAVAAVAGLGGGLYGPAAKAAIATIAAERDQARAFSWRGIAANVGTSLGPLIGTVLVRGSMPVLFGVAAALHLGLAVATWALISPERPDAHQARRSWRGILADTPFLSLSLVMVLAWALFAQLSIAVPLYASRVLGLEASVGLIWTVTSLVVVTLQVPVTRFVLSRLSALTAMATGALLLGAGLGLVGLARSFAALLGAVLLFVVGEMLLLPTADSVVSALARPELIGGYFGVASLTWGLGEAIGAGAGGALMQYSLRRGLLGLPWAIYAVSGGVIASGYVLLRSVARLRNPGPPEAPPAKRVRPMVYRPGYPALNASVRLGPDEEE